MLVTIKDIAKAAGVSHTTVSRALRGHPAISTETTRHIQQLAEQMGYVPSAVAQSLNSRQTFTIGMVVTTIADPFVPLVAEGIEKVAQEAGYSVFLMTSYNDPEREMTVVETLQRRRVDAIIVTASRVGSLYGEQLERIQVPIVLINNQENGEFLHSIAVDDVQGAKLATEHLLALGHRRIGYVGLLTRPKSNAHRLLGYQAALQKADIPQDPNLIFLPPPDDDFRCGELALSLHLKHQATAILCYNDITAIGLLNTCQQNQIAVPQALSIIGFDDIEAAQYVSPPLTTFRQPRLQMGELAMQMILDLLNKKSVEDQLLPGELIIRGSTVQIYPEQ
ncbi:MAG: LacI family DNA-binding transcriptional regulator [Anaerolineae bacterium]|nr:LacI family DNA-binding transcriptional regulator [Anaerolineae bacterium]